MKTTFKCFLSYKLKSSHFSSCLTLTKQSKTKVICKQLSIPIQPIDGSTGVSTQCSCCHQEGSCTQREGSTKALLSPPGTAPLWHCQHWQAWTCLSGLEELYHQCCTNSIHPAAPLVPQMGHPLEVGRGTALI